MNPKRLGRVAELTLAAHELFQYILRIRHDVEHFGAKCITIQLEVQVGWYTPIIYNDAAEREESAHLINKAPFVLYDVCLQTGNLIQKWRKLMGASFVRGVKKKDGNLGN